MNRSFRVFLVCVIAAAAVAVGACGRKKSNAPPVATPAVTLNHDRAPAGSPVEITYKFTVANDAKFAEDYRVFVHVVDNDDETLWYDDHNPPTPTSQWKPGQTVEYTRTVFVPIVPYVGDTTIQLGLHSLRDQHRLPLAGDDAGQQSYKVAHLQLLPPTDNLFTVFKDGWHPAETASQDGQTEWQWTRKSATLAFKNPKKDAILYLDLDSPQASFHGPQQVTISMGGKTVEQFALPPDERELKKIKLNGSQMGSADLAELQIDVDKTFVPAVVSAGSSKDPRELGVRVFHAFVDPR
jgi:hypothetical protein